MKVRYDELKENTRVFKSFTGVTEEEFEELEKKSEAIWIEEEKERLKRENRKRAKGGGRPPKLEFRDKLLLTLVWMKLYVNMDVLGFLFGVDKSTASRCTRSLCAILRQLGEETLVWIDPPEEEEPDPKVLDEVWEENPDTFAFVDAMEQSIKRSSQPEQQKKDYSGKKKTQTRKVQIVVNEDGIVRDVSESTHGSMHDRKHFTHSGVDKKIPTQLTVGGDLGYQGIHTNLPNHNVIVPFKKSKKHPLTDEQKVLNHEFSRARIIVENTLCQFRHFGILAQRFRHPVDIYDDIFRSVLAIVNPRIIRRVQAPT